MDGPEHVTYDVNDGIATIGFNRPEKLNAITFAMRDTFVQRLVQAGNDNSVRVVVILGRGRAFTSGVDVDDRPDLQDPSRSTAHDDATQIAASAAAWEQLWTLPQPVIVKAHGYCVGWGLEIALHADMVVATPDCQFFYPSISNGTGLPDSSMTIYHLGPQWAKRLLLAGDRIDGLTAERIGLVMQTLPEADIDAGVAALAQRLALLPPAQVSQSKAVVNHAIELMGRSRLQELAVEANTAVRRDPAAAQWSQVMREHGRHAAVQWRDQRRSE